MPFTGVPSRAAPMVGNSNASGEADLAVHDKELAVRAVVQLSPAEPVRLVEAFNLNACPAHLVDQRDVHLQTAHPIQQDMHLDPGLRTLAQSVHKLAPDAA